MIYILSGTNRPNSYTLQVAKILKGIYDAKKIPCELMSLEQIDFVMAGNYNTPLKSPVKEMVEKLTAAQGIHLVIPEYNGGMPGILKYFIDFFFYPKTFEWRPVCFIGLGGRFGGLRPVEHAQQIFGYRNAFAYPQRIFLQNVTQVVTGGKISDPKLMQLLEDQVAGFNKYIGALEDNKLDANSVNKTKA